MYISVYMYIYAYLVYIYMVAARNIHRGSDETPARRDSEARMQVLRAGPHEAAQGHDEARPGGAKGSFILGRPGCSRLLMTCSR